MLVARLYKTKRTPKRRKAIEIRLVDIQECPDADIAIAEMEIATLKAILSG